MSAVCVSPGPAVSIAERLAGYLDCHAQTLGESGFSALSKGWWGAALLTACLTVYVALIGYGMLSGRAFGPRQALLAALRAGVVIAFAGSWSAYEPVVYRVAIDGPAEVASHVLSPSRLSALSLPEAARRLQRAYSTLLTQGVSPQSSSPQPLQAGLQEPSSALDRTGVVLMVSVIGGLAAVRLAAGVLLALGPLIITLSLFDPMVGVLEGWARALGAAFIGSVGAMIVAALELDFVEAQLPLAGVIGSDPNLLLRGPGLTMTVDLFALGMVAVLATGVIVGWGFRLPRRLRSDLSLAEAARPRAPERGSGHGAAPEPASRARTVADAVLRMGRRERGADWDAVPGVERFARPRDLSAGAASGARPTSTHPLGSTLRRRTARPRAASAERLDNIR